MKKYTAAYLLWLAGVLSFAAVAYVYYRRVLQLGEDAIVVELADRARDSEPRPTPDEG